MAKDKRWLVRTEDGTFGVIVAKRRPRTPRRGWWNCRIQAIGTPCALSLRAEEYHLKPGGGPVELKG